MSEAAAMLDDPRVTWATAAYLAPFMNLALKKLVEDVLKIPDIGEITDIVVLPDVPADTRTLASYFDVGQPLENLSSVISMKERPVQNRNENAWTYMNPVRDVPTFNLLGFNGYYAFDGDEIKLPGASQTLDLRLFAKFRPGVIVDGDSYILPGISPILAFGAAQFAAMSRRAFDLSDRLKVEKNEVQASYLSNIILEMQGVRMRMRGHSGRGLNYTF